MYYIENKKNKAKNIFGKKLPKGEIFGLDNKVKGFVIVDRSYSTSDNLPTFMLANINPSGKYIDYNIKRLKVITELAAKEKINVLVLPELPVSGYVWDPENGDKEEVLSQLKKCATDSPLVTGLINYFRSY